MFSVVSCLSSNSLATAVVVVVEIKFDQKLVEMRLRLTSVVELFDNCVKKRKPKIIRRSHQAGILKERR